MQYQNIFARQRFDVGTSREYKVKLTPNDDRSAYSQSLSTPITLKDNITVELTLLHCYGIITTLPSSKYASPFFTKWMSSPLGGSAQNQKPRLTKLRKQQSPN